MNTKDLIELTISIIATLMIFGGLVYTGIQLKLTRKIHQENHDWNRRNAAQQAFYRYSDVVPSTGDLDRELKFATAEDQIQLDRITDAFKSNPELRITCHKLLNFYEGLAIGINQGLYDEEIIRTAWKGLMIRSFKSFELYIEHLRKKNRSKIFTALEARVKKWQHEDSNIDDRDFADKRY